MTAKRWREKWVADFTLDGKRIRRVSPVQTRRGAQTYEAELRAAWSTSAPCSGPSPRLDDFAVRWLTELVVIRNKPSDRVRKESILRVHLLPAFGARRLDTITARDLESYAAAKRSAGLAASTVNGHLAVLSALLRCAVEWGLLVAVPKITTLKVAPSTFDGLRPDEADAWHLVLRGVGLRVIQRLLSHSSIVTTERYAHVADASLTAAIATLKPEPRAPLHSRRPRGG